MHLVRRSPALPILTACILSGACAGGTSDGASPRHRVAVISFQHETCTFCPGGDVEIGDWTRVLTGPELLASSGYMRGFAEQARAFGDVELVPLSSPVGVYGGSSRSWNTQETFEHFLGGMLRELEAEGPVDGVFLALHGAMAVRGIPRPEAEIARRFREAVGPDVPIAGTFDLHGNEDAEFLEWADFAMVTKRYPHYDAHLQGERAARALRETMRGAYRPTSATRKPGIITPTVLQWTGASPSMEIMERARRWEAREPGVYVSVFYGYPWSDVPDVGATVHVVTNGDAELAEVIADDMADFMWRVREDFAQGRLPGPDSTAALVAGAVAEARIPVAVGDHSDRPGDGTHLLRAFEAAGIARVLYGTISSPSTLEALAADGAAPGDAVSVHVGGTTPSGGEPYPIEGVLEYIGEGWSFDRVAAISFGNGNLVVLTPAYTQVTDPRVFFREVGARLEEYDVFVVKSRVHFRRGFDETGFAPTILVAEAPEPFVGTTFLDALSYENVDLTGLYPYGTPPGR